MKQWRKSSRWRAAKKRAMSQKNWRLVSKLECLAYGSNPLSLDARIHCAWISESFRFGDSIIEFMNKPNPIEP